MNKIPFSHESNIFTESIGITDEERKHISEVMLDYITTGVKTIEKEKPHTFSMSTTIEYVTKHVTFTLKAQHYILIGMMLEKTLSSMEMSTIAKHISDLIKDIKLEQTIDDKKELIKN